MKSYYLDYAAATPLDERVFAVMVPYFSNKFHNPSAAYAAARAVKSDIQEARHTIAMVMGVKPSEIIFTAGASESVNLAIHGILNHYGGSVVTTPIEHPSVLAAANRHTHKLATVDSHGQVDIENIKASISDDTVLVSVGYVNSELGTIQPLRDVTTLIAGIRDDRRRRNITQPIYFHTDASQAVGNLDVSVSRLGVDLMTLNAAKCYGPKQVGLLWSRPDIQLSPIVDGGGQERGLRSGTENVAGIIGFAEAIAIANTTRKGETARLAKLRDSLQSRLVEAFPDLIINGHQKRRLPNHLHISLPGLDGERALFALDQEGVMVATGSACAANKGLRSHVLTAVGMEANLADASLRITLGRFTSDTDIDEVSTIMIDTLSRERGK